MFGVGNGYLGLRGNVEEGRDGHMHGTFVNGFHETWPIRHAEEAFGFARVGQTIVNVPDAKIIRLYVDDEPLVLTEAELLSYERRLDFRARRARAARSSGAPRRASACSSRAAAWRAFTDRHLAVIDYEVELLDAMPRSPSRARSSTGRTGATSTAAGVTRGARRVRPAQGRAVHRARAAAAGEARRRTAATCSATSARTRA